MLQVHPVATITERYLRTDRSRLGEWQSMDAKWKTAASSGLVSHDIYHHLPGDRGLFAEEVATFGAEWYIDLQPLKGKFSAIKERQLENFEKNVIDSLLNALDSREARPFDLPALTGAHLSDDEMSYFKVVASKALDVLIQSTDHRALNKPDFETRFVSVILWGFAQAQARFPDQYQVRAECSNLRYALSDLGQDEVPYGHIVTLTLDGYACEVSYEDADTDFLKDTDALPGLMMAWCTCEPGYPVKEITIHSDAAAYAQFVSDHFARQDEIELPPELQIIPRTESSELIKVYLCSASNKQIVRDGETLKLPLSALQNADYSPRQILIF